MASFRPDVNAVERAWLHAPAITAVGHNFRRTFAIGRRAPAIFVVEPFLDHYRTVLFRVSKEGGALPLICNLNVETGSAYIHETHMARLRLRARVTAHTYELPDPRTTYREFESLVIGAADQIAMAMLAAKVVRSHGGGLVLTPSED